jgi:DDE superfamily endonuclease
MQLFPERPGMFVMSLVWCSRLYLIDQIVSLPNLQIIDFAYGHTGSAHDATAWEGTQIFQEHEMLLENEEWVWGDSAYPVRVPARFELSLWLRLTKISRWVVAPYKKPERDLPDNEIFNNHVSMLRIRSEHAIGFLKGRFHSLKHLCINIKDEKTHKFATYWVAACIGLHAFAMRREAEENPHHELSDDEVRDPFINEGLSSNSDAPLSHDDAPLPRISARRLQAARDRREQLKRRLFRAKEQHSRQL